MTELMNQMAELLEAARREGIAQAYAYVAEWRNGLDAEQTPGYLDGIDDALLTIREL